MTGLVSSARQSSSACAQPPAQYSSGHAVNAARVRLRDNNLLYNELTVRAPSACALRAAAAVHWFTYMPVNSHPFTHSAVPSTLLLLFACLLACFPLAGWAAASCLLRAKGDKNAADQAAVDQMRRVLGVVEMSGVVVIGEGEKDEVSRLQCLRYRST